MSDIQQREIDRLLLFLLLLLLLLLLLNLPPHQGRNVNTEQGRLRGRNLMNRCEATWSGEAVDTRNFAEFGFDIRRGREIKHRFTCLSGVIFKRSG